MSKWEVPFGKDTDCMCKNNQGLFIPNRQLSALVAVLLLIMCTIFIAGYFTGKRYVVEQFTQKIAQQHFSDQIYTAVVTQAAEEDAHQSTIISGQYHDVADQTVDKVVAEPAVEPDESANEPTGERSAMLHYAQLIGFSTEKAANQFKQRLSDKAIEVVVKKRTSKTARGKVTAWYQVVTQESTNRAELELLVDRIVKEEKLKGVCIKSIQA